MKNLVLILIFCISSTSFAEKLKRENYKAIIKKAENLMNRRDRLKAMQILAQSIKREGLQTRQAAQLKEKLSYFGELFFTEKAQRSFEQGNSLLATKRAMALGKYSEALVLEPQNLSLIKQIARLHIISGSCSKGEEKIAKAEKLNPYDKEVKLLKAYFYICDEKEQELIEYFSLIKSDFLRSDKEFLRLEGELALREEKYIKALNISSKLMKADIGDVMSYYIRWRSLKSAGKLAVAEAQKYLNLCQSSEALLVKKYLVGSYVCRYKKELLAYVNSKRKEVLDE